MMQMLKVLSQIFNIELMLAASGGSWVTEYK